MGLDEESSLTGESVLTAAGAAPGSGGGGNGFGWAALQLDRAVALLGSQIDNAQYSNMVNPLDLTVTGAGGVLQYTGKAGAPLRRGGVWGASAAVPSGYIYFAGQNAAGVGPPQIDNLKARSWVAAVKMRINTQPAAQVIQCGFSDEVQTFAEFRIDPTGGNTVFQLIQSLDGTAPNTTRTAANANGTIGSGLALGTYYDLLLVRDANAGTLTFYQALSATKGALLLCATSAVETNMPTTIGYFRTTWNYLNALEVDDILVAWLQEP